MENEKIAVNERLVLRKRIADRIKLRRNLSRITQKEISRVVGCNEYTYRGYENCKSDVPITVLIKLADAYRTSVDYLTCRTDKHSIGKLALKYSPLLLKQETKSEITAENTETSSISANCHTCDYGIVLLDFVYCFSNPIRQGRKMYGKSCHPCELYINSNDYSKKPYLNHIEPD